MLGRVITSRYPRTFPGLSDAQSAVVWDRAHGHALAADEESELTEAERDELLAALDAQPPLDMLATFYLALVLFVADRPFLFLAGSILLPPMVVHLLYLGLRRLAGV